MSVCRQRRNSKILYNEEITSEGKAESEAMSPGHHAMTANDPSYEPGLPFLGKITSEGNFELQPMPPGHYAMITKSKCHEKVIKSVYVGEGENTIDVEAAKKPVKIFMARTEVEERGQYLRDYLLLLAEKLKEQGIKTQDGRKD